jgi:vacuolar protein sorting-associated protein 26
VRSIAKQLTDCFPIPSHRDPFLCLRSYFLRVKMTRNYSSNITQTLDFAVQNVSVEPEINNSIKMEVGIEDCLHIEFEYNKSKYHLQDVVIGKIYFLLVRIKIKHMEVVIIKRESTGSGPNQYNESENISKFEIMDGAPVRGTASVELLSE